MNKPAARSVNKTADNIQQRLTDYACTLKHSDLTPAAIHTAKSRVIDTLGALIGGFHGAPPRIARSLAAQMPNPNGSTIIGTRMKTTPDLAAFVNGATARYVEMNDVYHHPGTGQGHPSDVLTPILTVAEYMQVSGRDLITAIVLGYEVYQRISDVFHHRDFDPANFCCLGTAVATGKLLGLPPDQLSHCISMAVVPNNVLGQVRMGDHLSMFKSVAAGQAGRAGVFAALLARAGMEGPHLPFEGKAGWCDHVVRKRFSLDVLGGNGAPFKILDTHVKQRPSSGASIPSILAAEKIAPLNINDVHRITVEVYARAKESMGNSVARWNPDSRETADHSLPFVVAATLKDGTITTRSFNDANLWNPELRALIQKIEVVDNEEFTQAYKQTPQKHHSRVTVVTSSGERLVGESGGEKDNLSAPKSEAQVAGKFLGLTEDSLGSKRANVILDRLWRLDDMDSVAEIPPSFVLA